MADLAIRQEAGGDMVRAGRLVEVRDVTARALQRERREVVVYVAQRALRGDVRTREGE